MKKTLSLILMLLGVAILVSSPLYAASRAGAITATLGGGYEYFAAKRHIENSGFGFVALGYDFNQNWGIEGFLGWLNTNFKPSVDDPTDISGTLFAIDGLYHFSPYKEVIEPFILAGIGATGLSPNRNDARNSGNINAGIGTNIFIHPMIAFRFEVRDFYTIVGGKNDVLLDAGISFFFDTK